MASNFFEQKPFKPPFEIIARRTKTLDVKYKECKRNHAPQLGINVVDGCGEFAPKGMSPSSETGHVVDFDCEACGCHRNFHRKEVTKQVSITFIDKEGANLYRFQPRSPQLKNEQEAVENEELDGIMKKPKNDESM
ncbi:hypothetical protein ERO13_A11G245500v2 [Gossypium hirsutum]|nr:hypothetical protein ERO13_A11G245500v2 [Gossypium hirsutum]